MTTQNDSDQETGGISGAKAAGMLAPAVLAIFMAKLDTYIVCVSLPGMASRESQTPRSSS